MRFPITNYFCFFFDVDGLLALNLDIIAVIKTRLNPIVVNAITPNIT